MIYLNAHYSVIGERYGRPHRRHTAHCAETGRGEEREEEKHYTLRDTCKTAPPRRNANESASFPLSLGQFRSLPTMRGAACVGRRWRRRAPHRKLARQRGPRARLGPAGRMNARNGRPPARRSEYFAFGCVPAVLPPSYAGIVQRRRLKRMISASWEAAVRSRCYRSSRKRGYEKFEPRAGNVKKKRRARKFSLGHFRREPRVPSAFRERPLLFHETPPLSSRD